MLERCTFSFLAVPDEVFLGVSTAVVVAVVLADAVVAPSRFLLEGGGTCVDIVWLRWWSFEGVEEAVEWPWGVVMKGPEIVGWPLGPLEKEGEPIDPGPCVEGDCFGPRDGEGVDCKDELEEEEEAATGLIEGMPKGETRAELLLMREGVAVVGGGGGGGLADEGKKGVAELPLLDRRA